MYKILFNAEFPETHIFILNLDFIILISNDKKS